jgi:hypothetical protein
MAKHRAYQPTLKLFSTFPIHNLLLLLRDCGLLLLNFSRFILKTQIVKIMTLIQVYKNKVSLAEIRTHVEAFLLTKINANREVFESLTRMGNHYGGNSMPDRFHTAGQRTTLRELPAGVPSRQIVEEPDEYYYTNRYSVVYLFKEQYRHRGCSTYGEAQATLQALNDADERIPVGIYDDRTELFEWDAALRDEYERASMKDQAQKGAEIIRIAQAMRRRDSTWDSQEFRRPSFFA